MYPILKGMLIWFLSADYSNLFLWLKVQRAFLYFLAINLIKGGFRLSITKFFKEKIFKNYTLQVFLKKKGGGSLVFRESRRYKRY